MTDPSTSNEANRSEDISLHPKAEPGETLGLKTLTSRPWPIALGFGVLTFVVAMALDWFLLLNRNAPLAIAALSNTVVGLLAGALVFYLLEYGRVRRRLMLERIETLNEANHHIRNALQGIAFSLGALKDHKETPKISEAVTRIQWVLRELLPKLEPTYEPFEGSARQARESKSENPFTQHKSR